MTMTADLMQPLPVPVPDVDVHRPRPVPSRPVHTPRSHTSFEPFAGPTADFDIDLDLRKARMQRADRILPLPVPTDPSA